MTVDTYTVSHWNEATHAHQPSIFTTVQEFTFDGLGFVVLPQALAQAELSACNSDDLGDLCSEDGTVGRYVRALCGDGFRQDGPTKHVPFAAAEEYDEASLPLAGGVHTLDRGYINITGWNGRNADGASLSRAGGAWEEVRIRQCQGLVVAIALTDSADGTCPLVIVPASHKSGHDGPPEGFAVRHEFQLSCKARSVLLFNGQCWHAGGANQTEDNRYAVFAHYRKSMLMFQLDPHDEFPAAWYDRLNPRQRELMRMQKGVGASHAADGHFQSPPKR